MQHKLEKRHPLLDGNGYVIEAGWANKMILDYNRAAVKKGGIALKEWEYYLALREDKYAAGVTVVSAGPARILTVHFIDFKTQRAVCTSVPFLADDGGASLPSGIFSDYTVENDQARISYSYKDGRGYVSASMEDFCEGNPISVELSFPLPEKDLTVIVVPYTDPELFYYNCKANCMPATGYMELEGIRYDFSSESSMATYDWGRGIWEPVNQWYWGSASTRLNGVPFGFNIGHGFGDTSEATENMIFYDGVCHKLDRIEFQIPGDIIGDLKHRVPAKSYMEPWRFVTNDGRLDMDFRPILDRSSDVEDVAGFPAGQHQVFGYYSGVAVLDDGTRLPFKNVFGFAEKVVNVWPEM